MKYLIGLIVFVCLGLFVIWLGISFFSYEWVEMPSPLTWWVSDDTNLPDRFFAFILLLIYLVLCLGASATFFDKL
jgi:type III secretory pathway component EscS